MMKPNKIVLAGLLGISALTTVPSAALAHERWGREPRYDDDDDRGERHGYRYGGGIAAIIKRPRAM